MWCCVLCCGGVVCFGVLWCDVLCCSGVSGVVWYCGVVCPGVEGGGMVKKKGKNEWKWMSEEK